MPEPARVIRIVDGRPQILADDWRLVEDAAGWDAAQAAGPAALLVPLDLALAHPERLRAAGRAGVWLAPADDPSRVAPLLDEVSLVGVRFPVCTDGRGYSSAVLLRTRLGWRGELRALGDVLQDQLYGLRRVGFDSFALRADRDAHAALRAFATFCGAYQGSVEPALPAFRLAGGTP